MANNSILDYSKNSNLESTIVNGLLDQLSYLISVREEMIKNVSQVDEMINDIILEMRSTGIDINGLR